MEASPLLGAAFFEFEFELVGSGLLEFVLPLDPDSVSESSSVSLALAVFRAALAARAARAALASLSARGCGRSSDLALSKEDRASRGAFSFWFCQLARTPADSVSDLG